MKKRKSSIGRKMVTILTIIGVLTALMCFLNLMAYDVLADWNTQLVEHVKQLETVAQRGGNVTASVQNIEYVMERIDIKIEGTYIFDIILVVLALLITAVAIWISMRHIVSPTKKVSAKLNEIIESIRNNEGDLTVRVEVRSNDEVGQLAMGINEFVELLQNNMLTMKTNSDMMMQSVEEVAHQVDESNRSVTSVSSSSEELAAGMEEMAATIQQIASDTTEVLKQAQDISNTANASASTISELGIRVEKMHNEVASSKEKTTSVIGEIETSLTSAVQESASVKKIQELTNDILDIASQTNLLALNASIEAARAGDAGRGFAVVAEEIRVLAENSSHTANNIQEISNAVIQAVQKLSENSKDMLQFVDTNVLKDYDSFTEIMNQYQNDVKMLNDLVSGFASNASEMAGTMSSMNRNINDIAITVDESANAISTVASDASELVSAVIKISEEAENNETVSKQMAEVVSRFKKL